MRQKLQQIEYSPGLGKTSRVGAYRSVQNQDLPTASSHVETLGRRKSICFVVEPSFSQFPRAEDAAGSSQTLRIVFANTIASQDLRTHSGGKEGQSNIADFGTKPTAVPAVLSCNL